MTLTYSRGDPGSEFPVRFHAHRLGPPVDGDTVLLHCRDEEQGGHYELIVARDQGGDALGRFPKDSGSPLLAAVEVLEASRPTRPASATRKIAVL